jgi:hypothetical protein
MKVLFNVTTPLNKRTRTTEQYWHEITTFKHPQLKGRLREVELALIDPDKIKKSRTDEQVFLYYRWSEGRILCVVARHFDDNEGFVITAYFTHKEKEGKTVWQKNK